jgi:CubicO group peptidase (beta-lactamase class C family)
LSASLNAIEDLLTMRSGLGSTSGRNYGAWVLSRNWVGHALGQPMVSDPGTAMEYSTGTSRLLSAILTKATGVSTWQFAQDALARPLGFTLAKWPQDPQGIYFGGNEMLLTPKQMVSIGELYLRRGHWNGRQIVPAAWVDTSCVPRTSSVYDSDRQYGYGGQYIFVFRDLDLVVVATSSTAVSEERRGHRRRLFELTSSASSLRSEPRPLAELPRPGSALPWRQICRLRSSSSLRGGIALYSTG